MKRFVLLFFALAGFISSAAGQEQEITGFVYVSETPTPVPFASVWLCDPATGEPEYGTITAMNGWYDFGNVATDQTYQLKISGPGIRTRSKEIEIKYVPGRIGNIDYYIPVERCRYRSFPTRGNVSSQTDCPRCPDDRGSLQPYSGHNLRRWLFDRWKRRHGMSYVQRYYSGWGWICSYFDKSDRRQHRAYRILQTGQPGRAVLRRGIEFRNCRSEFQCPLH